MIQLRIYYDGRIVFSYSQLQPNFVAGSPQVESVKVGLSLTSLERLDLTDSLEKLDLEGGVVMIPRDQFYQAEWDTLIGRYPSRYFTLIG